MAAPDGKTDAPARRNTIEAGTPDGPPPPPPRDRPGEPDALSRTYYREDRDGERRYWDDYARTSLALRASGTTIATEREDRATVRAMLDLAEARGWGTVELKGSEAFRREAWIEAAARGIEARGHRPTQPEQQEAERRRAEREAPRRDPAEVPRETSPRPGRDGRELTPDLSPDGRLVFAALSEKIDRAMVRLDAGMKAELRAFVAGELVRKEREEGPVVLSAEQRRAAAAPEPVLPVKGMSPPRLDEPPPPRRAIGR
ncbi:LPD7 domain-containing protein (plasmid) [Roseomonas sp. CCTCC AB2023176]|uniref:LPD7 domain-containing protein n=1 Tax=Roseomonas sp. CCTCC AB2023176 TaxID=3342640 RepID=UPI0035E35AB6